jgi:hypothetical protein
MDPAWITAITALAVAVVALGAWGGRWAVRLLIGTHEFLVEWPKVRTAITELRTEVAEIKAETQPDAGNSLRDVVHRTAQDVAQIKTEQAGVRARLEVFDAGHTGLEGKGAT